MRRFVLLLAMATSCGQPQAGFSKEDPVAGTGTVSDPLRLTHSCSSNQILKWNGTAWACAADANSGGDITSITAGDGLAGGGSSGDLTLSLIACSSSQILKWNGTAWACAADDAGGGGPATETVQSVSTTGTITDLSLNASTTILRFTGASAVTLNSITGGTDGRVLKLENAMASATVTLTHDTGTTAANRFNLPGDVSTVITDSRVTTLIYNSTDSRWHVSHSDYESGTIRAISNTASAPGIILGSNGRGWYINGNELNQGHNSAISDTGYINYSGHAGSTSQFRNTWIGNGKQAATPILYANGTNSRVGIGTASPARTLDVAGTFGASGLATLPGGITMATGTASFGPLGGTNGGFVVNASTGDMYFQSFSSPVSYGTLGINKTNSLVAPLDIQDISFAPGTSSGRIDTGHPLIMSALPTSRWDTTAGDLYPVAIFVDSSLQKVAGSNKLVGITMRLDGNRAPGSGGADVGVALWIDKGEVWNSGHYMEVVRPTTTGYGPTQPPTVGTSCGTTPSGLVSGTDGGFAITVGGGSPTTCTMNFQMEFRDHTNTALASSQIGCILFASSNPAMITSASWTATTLTINGSSGLSGQISGKCWGTDNNIPLVP